MPHGEQMFSHDPYGFGDVVADAMTIRSIDLFSHNHDGTGRRNDAAKIFAQQMRRGTVQDDGTGAVLDITVDKCQLRMWIEFRESQKRLQTALCRTGLRGMNQAAKLRVIGYRGHDADERAAACAQGASQNVIGIPQFFRSLEDSVSGLLAYQMGRYKRPGYG